MQKKNKNNQKKYPWKKQSTGKNGNKAKNPQDLKTQEADMKPKFIDHIVIIIKDIKKTEKFYNKFLGKPEYTYKDSISYKIGETKIFFGLPYGEWRSTNKDLSGLNHLAFGVRTIEELRKFKEILNDSNIKNSGIIKEKDSKKDFIWFDDPDGIRLEFYLRK